MTSGEDSFEPAWSPDGKTIVFSEAGAIVAIDRRDRRGADADRPREQRLEPDLETGTRRNGMSSFVKQPDVRQESFDWGVIGWRLTPDSGSKQLVIMDVTLEPGGGHDFHRHPGQEEMIIVKQGRITQYIEQESTIARARRLRLPGRGRDPRVVQRRRRDRAAAGRDRPLARRRDGLRAGGRLGRGALGLAAQASGGRSGAARRRRCRGSTRRRARSDEKPASADRRGASRP